MELNGKDYTKYETGCAEVARSSFYSISFLHTSYHAYLFPSLSLSPFFCLTA